MDKLIGICLVAFGIVGWISNIVKIAGCSFDPLTAEPVIRIIGVFVAPIGVIMGYVPHF